MYYIIITFILLCIATLVLNHLGYVRIFKTRLPKETEGTATNIDPNSVAHNNHNNNNTIGFTFASNLPWLVTAKPAAELKVITRKTGEYSDNSICSIENNNSATADKFYDLEVKKKYDLTTDVKSNNSNDFSPSAPEIEYSDNKTNINNNTSTSKYARFYNPTNQHLIIEKNLTR